MKWRIRTAVANNNLLTFRKKRLQPVTQHIYDVVGGKSVDCEPTKGEDEVYSEIKTSPTTITEGGKGKFSMSKCAAYAPSIFSTGKEKENHYEVMEAVSNM